MEEVIYPSIKPTTEGWIVQPSKGASLPGVYTSESSAKRALRKYNINQERYKELRKNKKLKSKKNNKKDK